MKVIALEGIDACGKATQATRLGYELYKMGYKMRVQSFPRYSKSVGGWIGEALKGKVEMTPEAFHMLYEVDRQDFMKDISQLQENGYDFLILDRWTLSNEVFVAAKGLDIEWIKSIQATLTKPDITFILDIPVETSFARRPERRDLHEKDVNLLTNVRSEYLAAAERHSKADELIYVINGEKQSHEITHELLAHVTLGLLNPELVDVDTNEKSIPIF
jgi:dTMP kinase